MVRVLLSNVSFMHRLFLSPRFRMDEKSYCYRKVELLAFWNKHSTKQIWKCRSAYQWKWQHLCWLLSCMNVWIPLHKNKWLISTTADTHTHILSLSVPTLILCGGVLCILCVQTRLNLIYFKKNIIHKGAISFVFSKFAQLYRAGRCL